MSQKAIETFRSYVDSQPGWDPPVLEYFQKGAGDSLPFPAASERGCRLLLVYAAHYQDISERALAQWLVWLFRALGDRLESAQAIPFSYLWDLLASHPWYHQWKLGPKSAGILRSLGDYFRLRHPFGHYLESLPDSEALVDDLCSRIFLMGRRSPNRFKARYYVMLLLHSNPQRFGRLWGPLSRLPLTAGSRRFAARYLSPPQADASGTSDAYPPEFLGLGADVAPKAFGTLQRYLARVYGSDFQCSQAIGGCGECPLRVSCRFSQK